MWEKTDTTTVAATDEEINAETHFPCMDVTGVWKDCFDPAKGSPGKGTVVAVIDTGVDYTHKDLADNIWVNEGEIPGNGIDDDGNGYVDDVHGVDFVDGDSDPMDEHGHGTRCRHNRNDPWQWRRSRCCIWCKDNVRKSRSGERKLCKLGYRQGDKVCR